MDEISPVLERHLNNLTLSDLYKAQREQYAEVGYYFDTLCYNRVKLQYIKSVIKKKIHRERLEREKGSG